MSPSRYDSIYHEGPEDLSLEEEEGKTEEINHFITILNGNY